MTCSRELRRQGKPYPRTCPTCGFGPCKRPETITAEGSGAPLPEWEELSFDDRENLMKSAQWFGLKGVYGAIRQMTLQGRT